MDTNKVPRLIFDAESAFNLDEAAEVAKKMKWKLHTSPGEFMTEDEISGTLGICVSAALTQYRKNCEAGYPFKFIYCGTGRVSVRVDFWTPDSPDVKISFGTFVSRS